MAAQGRARSPALTILYALIFVLMLMPLWGTTKHENPPQSPFFKGGGGSPLWKRGVRGDFEAYFHIKKVKEMFWEKLFGKKKEPLDVTSELILSNLKIGYLVDYDLKTWQVTARHRYDWGGGFVSQEWELRSANQVCYLEREKDDEIVWILSKKIPLSSFPLDIKKYLIEHEDPPKELVYQGIIFKLESEAVGRFYQGEKDPAIEFICWDYLDPSGERIVTIEQWGEREFEAAEGKYVEEYQFSNILPRENSS